MSGGATDVSGTFDDTLICTDVSCTDFSMTLESSQTFNGLLWTAHDIRTFSEGSYTFDTNCTGADIAAGTTDCGGGAPLDLTVGAGQLGAHMLFDWGTQADIDVAVVWNIDDSFGSPIYDGAGTANEDLTQTPTRIWNVASKDGNGDGIQGIPMVDGAFVGFNANFNLDMVPPFSLPNIPPTAFDFSASTVVDTPTTIDMTGHASDPDGALDPTSTAIVPGSGPTNGTLVNNGDGTVTYAPTLGFVSPPTDSFQYTIDDDFGVTSNVATVTITVTVVANTPPVANDAPVATDEDISLDITVDSVASDADGGSLTFENFDATSAEGGAVVVDPANTILTYTPAPDFNGLDTFSYFVTDGLDSSNMATVTVNCQRGQ